MLDEQSVCSRKQSASDLQSRLKTRKWLGVGELSGDNGEIYRSKISQLLGINESLYVRLPRGLLYWNTMNTVYFYILGAMYLLFPSSALRLELGAFTSNPETLLVSRLYGCVLLSFGLLFRNVILQRDTRSEIASLLLVTASFHFLQMLVVSTSMGVSLALLLPKVIGIAGNVIYHAYVDTQGGVHRQLMRLLNDHCILSSPTIERKPEMSARAKDD